MICVTIFMTENRKIVHSKTLTFSGHQTDRQTDRQTDERALRECILCKIGLTD